MRRALAVVALTAMVAGHAAPARALTWDEFWRVVDQGCQYLGSTENFEWLCTFRYIRSRLEYLVRHGGEELELFAKELGWDVARQALSWAGGQLGFAKLTQYTNQLYNALLYGPTELKDRIRRIVLGLTKDRLDQLVRGERRYPQYSPSWWRAWAVSSHPNLGAVEVVNTVREAQMATEPQIFNAAYQMQQADSMKQWSSQTVPMQEYTTKILGVPGVTEGKIDQIKKRARTADSTRAAVQYLTEALADLMGAQAMATIELASRLDRLLEQQVMTGYQMQAVAQQMAQERQEEAAALRAALEKELGDAYQEGEQAAHAMGQGGRSLLATSAGVLLP